MNRLRRPARALSRIAGERRPRFRRPAVEVLEARQLLAIVSVNASQIIRTVDTQLLGVNLVNWDSNENTTQTEQMVQAAGLNMFRFPGGSSSDDFHFNAPPAYNGAGTDASMASFISSVNGVGLATLDYGSGSPQEAAAFLAYLEAPVGNTTQIGSGQEWNDSTNQYQTINWQTAGNWASLRAAAPLPQDDGLNFLRLNHPAPFNVPDWEVGNEEYGSWEVDHHAAQHDPATYIAFAKQFATYAATIDPAISIGLDVGSPGSDYNNWTAAILQQSVAQGFMPGFLSDHNYVQAPGSESDSNLLLNTTTGTNSDPTDPGNPYNWAARSAGYESLLQKYLGSAAGNVQLLATEFNSVYSNPGKQTTSLVNGLWVADSLGALLETPYNGADVWDLRNYYDNSNNNSSSLYGWRTSGDYGIIGSPNGSPPGSGTYVPYPTYFAEQLASKIIEAGGKVVQSSSNDPNLTTYAVLEANGQLELLVINKNASSALAGQFQITGFQPTAQATLWQYGEAQDTAQSHSSTGASALANSTTSLTLSGSNFNYSFPAYSMSVLVLAPASTPVPPTIVNPASATPSPVTGTSTMLKALATDPAGASTLTYTWATTGTPPASVSFSANGTNAAQTTTAAFTKAGSYSFQVTARDPSGLTATSSVTVVVNQTATTLVVSPGTVTVAAGGTKTFTAQVDDQFGAPLASQPALTWSVASGGGTIVAGTGVYTAPNAGGAAVVKAASGSVSGSANVTISPPVATASASLIGVNSTLEGNWMGTYGSQGYNIIGGPSSYPSYATVSVSGAQSKVWTAGTTDPRALQLPGGTTREAGALYTTTNFSLNVNFTDGNVHDLAIYFLDWSYYGRSEQVQINDAGSGALLVNETVSNFNSGLYQQFKISGNVVITFNELGGLDPVLSALFFDSPAAATAASLVNQDTTTQGTWIGKYGSQGYNIIGGPSNYPSYATVSVSGAQSKVWTASTTDPRALQLPGGTAREAGALYTNTSFSVNVNFTDGNAHYLAIYFLDWSYYGRSEQVQITSASSGAVLVNETASNFNTGLYQQFKISGNVIITFSELGGLDPVLSALFFDSPTASSSAVAGSAAAPEIASDDSKTLVADGAGALDFASAGSPAASIANANSSVVDTVVPTLVVPLDVAEPRRPLVTQNLSDRPFRGRRWFMTA